MRYINERCVSWDAHCEEACVGKGARDLGSFHQVSSVAVGRVHLHAPQSPWVLPVLLPGWLRLPDHL